MRVLDLGCGAAISSIFLARELGVQVWAADLWIDPTQNRRRIEEAGVGDRVFPIEAEAHTLPVRARVLRRARERRLVPLLRHRRALPLVRRAVRSARWRDRHRRARQRRRSRRPSRRRRGPRAVRRRLLHVPERRVVGASLAAHRRCRRDRTRTCFPDGRELWLRYLRASEAWDGIPVAESVDGRCSSPSTAPPWASPRHTRRPKTDAHIRTGQIHVPDADATLRLRPCALHRPCTRRRSGVRDLRLTNRRSGSSTRRAHEVDLTDAVAGPLAGHRALDRASRAGRRDRARRARRRARSSARRSVSSSANRHVRNWPSAVMRTRSQFSQNGSVTLGITPTSPRPSR